MTKDLSCPGLRLETRFKALPSLSSSSQSEFSQTTSQKAPSEHFRGESCSCFLYSPGSSGETWASAVPPGMEALASHTGSRDK